MRTSIVSMFYYLLAALLGAVGQYLFKVGSKTVSTNLTSWILNYKIITAGKLVRRKGDVYSADQDDNGEYHHGQGQVQPVNHDQRGSNDSAAQHTDGKPAAPTGHQRKTKQHLHIQPPSKSKRCVARLLTIFHTILTLSAPRSITRK